jgi:type I restriction enzyme S subunit
LQGWGQVAAPNVFIAFRLKDAYSNGFFQNCFEQNQHGKQLKKHITSGARSNGLLNISKDTFFGIEIATPASPEQQKIADCLGSADALITAQGRRVEALRAHKMGLMQQLFPRPERIEDGIKIPAESFPRLRFTEFQNSGNWEVMTIEEMIENDLLIGHLDGNHGELYPKSEEFSPNNDGIPYISANDFLHGSVDFSKCKRLPIARARLFKKGIAKDGDILFAHNATVGPVAKLETDEEFVILSTTATYFRCNREKLSNDFLKFALSSPSFVAQYTPVMAQSTRNQVPITTQRTLRLHVPKQAEQQRIADCLTSLDDLIVSESLALKNLKTHKKGLMQQLFPLVGEDDA